jgi:uncharacterized protein (UPF0264 family)
MDTTIAAVIELVAGRKPVSAALGELLEKPRPYLGTGLAFAKWGLAGSGAQPDWRDLLCQHAKTLRRFAPGCRPVAVAYADWVQAGAPPPAEVCAFACDLGWPAFLLDTWAKDGRSLLHWLSVPEVEAMCRRCHRAGVRIALAGSLGQRHIRCLRTAAPDWIAVRGAVCAHSSRTGVIDRQRVRRFADLVTSPVPPAIPGN